MAGSGAGVHVLHCMAARLPAGRDAMHFKVRDNGKVRHRALYNILGINKDGYKEVLGMYVSESEGANFWLQVLTDLQNRGLDDILIACTDNLKGFTEAILSIYPKTEVQLCIVHQIRNSLKYVASRDQKGIYERPQACLSCHKQRYCRRRAFKTRGQIGTKISCCYRKLEQQQGSTLRIF